MVWLFSQTLRRNIGRSEITRSEKEAYEQIYRNGCEDLRSSQLGDVSQSLSLAKYGPIDKQNSKVEGIIDPGHWGEAGQGSGGKETYVWPLSDPLW